MHIILKLLAGCGCLAALASSLTSAAGSPDLRLLQAAKSNDIEAVRRLVNQKTADVNACQGDGATALHWAARLDNIALADLLLRAGARVNAANDDGATALYLACTNRSAAMVERLLAAGADANSKLLNGETALMTCARTGEAKAVKSLLAHSAAVNARESSHHQTALMWAAAQRHPEVVAVLLEFGADFRARSLIYPQTVVGEQTQRAGREELNYTVQRGGSTALLFAARVGDVESSRLLLTAGADVNDELADGTSALILAAHSGQGPAAELLLEKGADPNNADIGYTALHAAVLRSEVSLVRALLAHGANPNIRMTKGTPLRRDTTDFNLPAPLIGATPLLLAAKFLEVEILRVLVAGGAGLKLTMPNGATPLLLAAGMGSNPNQSRRGISRVDFGKVEPESRVLEGVAAVLSFKVDVNAGNQAGDTALHTAASLGYNSVVKLLVEQGANVNAKNQRGFTPLMAALDPTGRGGRARPVDPGADDTGIRRPPISHQSTAALLRKLGATE
jgi:ankyrin repeat protein